MDLSQTPHLADPRSYVPGRGIVEIQFGTENLTIETREDLYDYVRTSMSDHERFPPDFCARDKLNHKRKWFHCLVCPCDLYKDENLVNHCKGQKHQKFLGYKKE